MPVRVAREVWRVFFFFFFNDTATTEFYTLSLHDALPIYARTLPATATVLPNQPGFDWAKVRALPEVSALSTFPVSFGFALDCCPDAGTGFPPADSELTRTIERPVVLEGRLFN